MSPRVADPSRRSITFAEFQQVVRRFRPSGLLPMLGHMACALGEPPFDWDIVKFVQPWGIALMAREAILRGNEHRPDATVDGLKALINAHNNIYEQPVRPEDRSAHSILTRVAYEQFPYQESMFEELSRTKALLIDGLPDIEAEVLSDEAWRTVLGASLPEVVGATFALHAGATANNGWYDTAWLDGDEIQEIFDYWPKDAILDRLDRLTHSFDTFRAAYREVPKPARGFERYAYNPLTARPFVSWGSGRYLAPQPRLILRTVTPGNLYYDGIRALGPAFARDLGRLTEHYVGVQLRTIPAAVVHPEIKYGRPEKKSIDWFLVLPSVVLMFEVKSARFGLLDRAASEGFEDHVAQVLGKAVNQIERSHAALTAGLPEFQHIPTDRPAIGLVVTAEPYYLANSPMVRSLLPSAGIPILTASLRDIERLVSLPAAVIEAEIRAIVADPDRSTWSLGLAIADIPAPRRNPVLEAAWDSYPWPFPDEGE